MINNNLTIPSGLQINLFNYKKNNLLNNNNISNINLFSKVSETPLSGLLPHFINRDNDIISLNSTQIGGNLRDNSRHFSYNGNSDLNNNSEFNLDLGEVGEIGNQPNDSLVCSAELSNNISQSGGNLRDNSRHFSYDGNSDLNNNSEFGLELGEVGEIGNQPNDSLVCSAELNNLN